MVTNCLISQSGTTVSGMSRNARKERINISIGRDDRAGIAALPKRFHKKQVTREVVTVNAICLPKSSPKQHNQDAGDHADRQPLVPYASSMLEQPATLMIQLSIASR